MTRINSLQHEFVSYIPDALDDGVLYVSIPFVIAMHLCCCGCGKEVVTPLDPDGWHMTFDGESVSLWPSIGNWSFDCQSHYSIRRNQVAWVRRLSEDEIEEGRAHCRLEEAQQFDNVSSQGAGSTAEALSPTPRKSLWRFLRKWLRRISARSHDVRQ